MTEPTTSRGRGCFLYGCLIAVLLGLGVLVGGYFTVRHYVNKFVDRYTDTTPMALPTLDLTPTEIHDATARLDAFKQAIVAGTNGPALSLGNRELNALVAGAPDFADLKDRVYLSIEGDTLKGQVSVPLDKLPIGRVKGRYLNGAAGIKVSLDNGVLLVTLDSLQVKGRELPEEVMSQLRRNNLAKDLYGKPETAEVLRHLERIEVHDGKLVITPRQTPTPAKPTQ